MKAHLRVLGCYAVIGYSEYTSIWYVQCSRCVYSSVHMTGHDFKHTLKQQCHEVSMYLHVHVCTMFINASGIEASFTVSYMYMYFLPGTSQGILPVYTCFMA